MSKIKLKRTLSSTNKKAAENIYLYKDDQYQSQVDKVPIINRDVIKSSMIIPAQYGKLALLLCVDEDMLYALEDQSCVNWCDSSRFLLPLDTLPDGNCLLHSISLYIFGVHDRDLTLRKLLYQRLFMEQPNGLILKRWKYNQTLDRVQCKRTWEDILNSCSSKQYQVNGGVVYNIVTDIHIFAIANILGRAIIVLCDRTRGSESLEGVYLPLLRSQKDCEKSPIIIGYKNNHFVPLLSSENVVIPVCKNRPSDLALHCIPLLRYDHVLSELPVKFLLEEENIRKPELLGRYLELCTIPFKGKSILAAMLKFKPPPAWSIELMWSLYNLSEEIAKENDAMFEEPDYSSLKVCARQKVKNCTNYASNNKENLCNECYEQYLREKSKIPKRNSVKSRLDSKSGSKSPPIPHEGYLGNCATVGCKGIAFPEFRDLCTKCYQSTIENPILNDLNTEPAYNSPYIPARSPLIPPNYENVRKNFDDKPVVPNFNSPYIPARSPLIPPSVPPSIPPSLPQTRSKNTTEQISAGHSIHNFSGQSNLYEPGESRMINSAAENENLYQVPRASAVALEFKGKTNPARQHQYNSPTAATPESYDRRKILCSYAGCEGTLNLDNKYCDVHYEDASSRMRSNCMIPDCENMAESNDLNLCMFCFQSQRHILKDIEQQNCVKVDDDEFQFDYRRNIGRGPSKPQVDLASIASNFPPLPAPSLPPSGMESIPPIPHVQSGYKQECQVTRPISPKTKHGSIVSPYNTRFQPPQVYEGFAGGKVTNFGTQHGVMNWQKERVEQRCSYCENPSNPNKKGLCDRCFQIKRKDVTEKSKSELKKCINDGCRSPGNIEYNYLCEDCYGDQLKQMGVKPHSVSLGNVPKENHNRPQDYSAARNVCLTKGCPYLTIPPAKVCDVCKQNLDPSKHQQIDPSKQRTSLNVNKEEPVQGARVPCKGLDCDFFGSVEYGGYCSGCFLEKTKQDEIVKKQNGIRTYAPQNVYIEQRPINRHSEGEGTFHSLPLVQGIAASVPCRRHGCDCYGRPEWNGLCSVCFKQQPIERDSLLRT